MDSSSGRQEFPNDKRINIAISAAAQVEALAVGMIQQMEDGPPPRGPILNAVAVRLMDLSRATLSALGDEIHPYKELARVVNHGQAIVVPDEDDDDTEAANG